MSSWYEGQPAKLRRVTAADGRRGWGKQRREPTRVEWLMTDYLTIASRRVARGERRASGASDSRATARSILNPDEVAVKSTQLLPGVYCCKKHVTVLPYPPQTKRARTPCAHTRAMAPPALHYAIQTHHLSAVLPHLSAKACMERCGEDEASVEAIVASRGGGSIMGWSASGMCAAQIALLEASVAKDKGRAWEVMQVVLEATPLETLSTSRWGSGNTALHLASFLGLSNVVRILLDRGCDARLRNELGKTAIDVAADQATRSAFTARPKPTPAAVVITEAAGGVARAAEAKIDMSPVRAEAPTAATWNDAVALKERGAVSKSPFREMMRRSTESRAGGGAADNAKPDGDAISSTVAPVVASEPTTPTRAPTAAAALWRSPPDQQTIAQSTNNSAATHPLRRYDTDMGPRKAPASRPSLEGLFIDTRRSKTADDAPDIGKREAVAPIAVPPPSPHMIPTSPSRFAVARNAFEKSAGVDGGAGLTPANRSTKNSSFFLYGGRIGRNSISLRSSAAALFELEADKQNIKADPEFKEADLELVEGSNSRTAERAPHTSQSVRVGLKKESKRPPLPLAADWFRPPHAASDVTPEAADSEKIKEVGRVDGAVVATESETVCSDEGPKEVDERKADATGVELSSKAIRPEPVVRDIAASRTRPAAVVAAVVEIPVTEIPVKKEADERRTDATGAELPSKGIKPESVVKDIVASLTRPAAEPQTRAAAVAEIPATQIPVAADINEAAIKPIDKKQRDTKIVAQPTASPTPDARKVPPPAAAAESSSADASRSGPPALAAWMSRDHHASRPPTVVVERGVRIPKPLPPTVLVRRPASGDESVTAWILDDAERASAVVGQPSPGPGPVAGSPQRAVAAAVVPGAVPKPSPDAAVPVVRVSLDGDDAVANEREVDDDNARSEVRDEETDAAADTPEVVVAPKSLVLDMPSISVGSLFDTSDWLITLIAPPSALAPPTNADAIIYQSIVDPPAARLATIEEEEPGPFTLEEQAPIAEKATAHSPAPPAELWDGGHRVPATGLPAEAAERVASLGSIVDDIIGRERKPGKKKSVRVDVNVFLMAGYLLFGGSQRAWKGELETRWIVNEEFAPRASKEGATGVLLLRDIHMEISVSQEGDSHSCGRVVVAAGQRDVEINFECAILRPIASVPRGRSYAERSLESSHQEEALAPVWVAQPSARVGSRGGGRAQQRRQRGGGSRREVGCADWDCAGCPRYFRRCRSLGSAG
ncbi:hypothetical protein BDK51DRAFT_39719 [Blyttiomyces helicus]|uniref:Uncharacterized protein n=1 Tax=Blyttiomyces helicus TaxID=388810 RepID=A0A4P9WCJ1_9FUNG|nr:hypothetical protein BDK51DRAFT_39719 [Blyttiomyces helicus]|eukprot:RKO90379.1 hypothetical protein BDK51DRAFT_39719 [Blyttiomyces helicus]